LPKRRNDAQRRYNLSVSEAIEIRIGNLRSRMQASADSRGSEEGDPNLEEGSSTAQGWKRGGQSRAAPGAGESEALLGKKAEHQCREWKAPAQTSYQIRGILVFATTPKRKEVHIAT